MTKDGLGAGMEKYDPTAEPHNPEQRVSIRRMIEESRYDRSDNKTTLKALQIVHDLEDWVSTVAECEHPVPNLMVLTHTLVVCIGDICVWSSETDGEDELSLIACIQSYQEAIRPYAQIAGLLTPSHKE